MMATGMMGAFGQMLTPTPQEQGELGNRTPAPQRAIDKLLMSQQQMKQQGMAFPLGIPKNEQPPQMLNANAPSANSFMGAVLGQQGNIGR